MENAKQAPAQQQPTQRTDAPQHRRNETSEGDARRSPTPHTQTDRTPTKDGHTAAAAIRPAQQQFNTLRRLGKFISGLGWLVVIAGVLIALLGFFGGYAVGLEAMAMGGIAGLAVGFSISVYGLMMVATGQLFSCFVAIERNTRSTYEMMRHRHQ